LIGRARGAASDGKIHTSLLPPEQFWSDRNKNLMSQFTAGMPDVLANAEDLV
jgi:hypothetical protein